VPNDQNPPFYPSGIRFGTAALTTRGLKEKDMVKVAKWMNEVVQRLPKMELPKSKEERAVVWEKFQKETLKNKNLLQIGKEVKAFALKFPTP